LTRTPPPTGLPGDVAGTVAVDANYIYVCTDSFDSNVVQRTVETTLSGNVIQILPSTTGLVVNAPIVFTGNVDTANTNLVANTVYYIKTTQVDTLTGNITISATRTGGTAGSTFVVGAKANLTINANAYIGTNVWKRVELSTW
jgi:lipopolysaccharide assembly outer membrane protein LptD (OstA)